VTNDVPTVTLLPADGLTTPSKLPWLADHVVVDDQHLQVLAFLPNHVLQLTAEYQLQEHSHHHHHATAIVDVVQNVALQAPV
jgi:hypothetical protein